MPLPRHFGHVRQASREDPNERLPSVPSKEIRSGKDWSALAAECDALLETCRRPDKGNGKAIEKGADRPPSEGVEESDLDL